MANNQNSDQNSWRISKEFHSHLIFEEFWWNPGWFSQEFCDHLIFEEFDSHQNSWILGLGPEFWLKLLKNFTRIMWSSNSLKEFWSKYLWNFTRISWSSHFLIGILIRILWRILIKFWKNFPRTSNHLIFQW